MAYPLGVVGIIMSILAMRWIFKIKMEKEEERLAAESSTQTEIEYIDILLANPQVEGAHIRDLSQLCHMDLIVSRLVRPNGEDELPDVDTILHVGDRIRVVVDKENEKSVLLLGMETSLPTDHKAQVHLVSRHVVVTKAELNGKRIGDLKVRATYHVSITRIRRAGIELLATRDLYLQLGDRITVVGEERAVDKVEQLFGNSTKRLDVPNLASIFLGLALGVGLKSLELTCVRTTGRCGVSSNSSANKSLASRRTSRVSLPLMTTRAAMPSCLSHSSSRGRIFDTSGVAIRPP
jgi:putative transport protein